MATPDRDIKLVITDLDNTALLPDRTISKRTSEAFRRLRQRGIRTAVATARAYAKSAFFLPELGADCAVMNDGTVVFDGEELVCSAPLPDGVAESIIAAAMAAGCSEFIHVITAKGIIWNRDTGERVINSSIADFSAPFRLGEPVYKVLMVVRDPLLAESFASGLDCRVQRYRDEPLYGYINSSSSKVQGVRMLCRHLGIDLSEAAAFGDDENDLEVLRVCGQGIAVANAIPEALAAADFVTGSNLQDGVADYIERHFLK